MFRFFSGQCWVIFLALYANALFSEPSFAKPIDFLGKIDWEHTGESYQGVLYASTGLKYIFEVEPPQITSGFVMLGGKKYARWSAVKVKGNAVINVITQFESIEPYFYSSSEVKGVYCDLLDYEALFFPTIKIFKVNDEFVADTWALVDTEVSTGMIYRHLKRPVDKPRLLRFIGEDERSSMEISIPIEDSSLANLKGHLTIRQKGLEPPANGWIYTGEDMDVSCQLAL